jgi:hypothetical protein
MEVCSLLAVGGEFSFDFRSRRRTPFEDAPAMFVISRARAVSNHEGGPSAATSFFETHPTVDKC